jgi:hypothetical protein
MVVIGWRLLLGPHPEAREVVCGGADRAEKIIIWVERGAEFGDL